MLDGSDKRHVADTAWSPDGKQIAFFRWFAQAVIASLCLVLCAPASATLPGRNGQLAAAVERGDCDENSDQECGDINFEIVGIDPRTGHRTALDICPGRRFCDDRGVTWSPDGRWIAFSRLQGGDARDLFISTPDGSGTRMVVPRGGRPSWSPDGRRLVFERGAGDYGGLWVSGVDGTGLTQLTVDTSYQADWSSRDRIVFDRGVDLYSIRPDGEGRRRLTRVRDQFDVVSPSWSPDGRRIAFARFEPPERERPPSVFTMRADGRGKRRVVDDGLWPTWSPDGKRIAFVRNQSVFVIRTDGTGLRRVRRLRARIWDLAWQPRP